MKRYLTCAQMRAADEYTINALKVSGGALMRRAGEAIADEAERAAAESGVRDILVVCGCGNNGGDGYACAEELRKRGYAVSVYALDGKLSPDCAEKKRAYGGGYSRDIRGSIVIDCIFGTGLSRAVEGNPREVINAVNGSGAFVLSADIPSGLNGDDGRVCGVAVRADITVAIAQLKAGFVLGDGPDYCGKIVLKDIGIYSDSFIAEEYEDGDIKPFFPKRRRNSHKGSYGKACLVAGSSKYRGAAALSLSAALRSGCGYAMLCTDGGVASSLCTKFPQAIFIDEPDPSADCIAVGMGCGKSRELYGLILKLLSGYKGKLLIDADGLNALSAYGADALKNKECAVLITPHIAEFSRLSGLSREEILSAPVQAAKNFAAEYGVTVLLKNSVSVITDGVRTVFNTRGTTALAKAGSGDLLSGLIAGSAARGLSLLDAAVCSQYALGLSAEISSEEYTDYCVTSRELIKNLPAAVKRLTS